MTRNLKALGIALVAMFAMSAVAAASASAAQHHFTSSSETTYLTAHSLGEQKFWATTSEPEGNRVFCKSSGVNGMTTGLEVSEVTVEPSYGECSAFTGGSEVKAKVTVNGCNYVFTGVTEEDVTGNQTATVHLTCPAEKQVEVEVTGLNLKCLDMPGGQTLRGVKYETDEESEPHGLIVDAKVHGIESKTTGACGEGTHNDGKYEGRVTVEGFKDEAHTQRVTLGLKTTP